MGICHDELLGPKSRSEFIRISFLGYSSMLLQGLKWILHLKAIYRQNCRLWATITMMFVSVTDGQDQRLILYIFSSPHCVPLLLSLFYCASSVTFFLIYLPKQLVHLRNPSSSNFPSVVPSIFRQNKYILSSIHAHMMFLL